MCRVLTCIVIPYPFLDYPTLGLGIYRTIKLSTLKKGHGMSLHVVPRGSRYPILMDSGPKKTKP